MMAWIGNTDMTLHRLDRGEILREFDWIAANIGGCDESEVVSVNRHGAKSRIVKVKDDGRSVFLCPFDDSDPGAKALLDLAPYMGSDAKPMDFGVLKGILRGCLSKDVFLQWPAQEPKTVVGKILAVKVGGKLTVILVPVPKDIEEVNERARRECAKRGCEMIKRYGAKCGECSAFGTCSILKEVDEMLVKENEDGDKDIHD